MGSAGVAVGGAGGSIVSVASLVKRYGKTLALRGVSMDVSEGDRLVVVGPNGSGKSTLIKVIVGLTPPTSGVVRVLGHDPLRMPSRVRASLGYLPEKTSIPGGFRVEDYVAYFAECRGCSEGEFIDILGLRRYARSKIRTLSQGFKRRVMLAAALACWPKLIVLDEPYSNVDVGTRAAIDDALSNAPRGATMVITTHIEPGFGNYRLAVMMGGRLAELRESVRRGYVVLECVGGEVVRTNDMVRATELIRSGKCVLKDAGREGIYEIFRRVAGATRLSSD